ncbi:DUF4864 domain-containing protein [Mesorhizobium sp. NBSH29]|uniref:DUF4864 domain-containing protein n=1 Tax=Mesorhizobium sp. NBSH29 TaxID=2654249 RepID=UPI00189688F3|nr:DUF4864 domain-containing protein [Mesorhizobium sp. NBSH29]QPC88721.1 DUF4864 domain-containing protein [Mesorhizobium sp. NBSH29]
MRPAVLLICLSLAASLPAHSGEAEIAAGQATIQSQIGAFRSGDNARAYSFAAPNVQRIFPTLDRFMGMVTGTYRPVYQPDSFSFGEAREGAPGTIAQQVFLVGPDGKNYEAIYTLELQPDGTFRITGVSLRGAQTLTM